jgi:3-oxoacyl-[acyl-carrier-protein] synthase II
LVALVAIQAVVDQRLPPTVGLASLLPSEHSDLRLDHVARSAELHHVLSNAFGFGGANAAVIFSVVR